ncbi:MAG: hypothetical protein CL484_15130 [Acidobacteria bacterium]|nr:hypothetical protein [Acidobacteriota bacterium]|tara:strand:+ start:260 stop:463 length:204 start_codon:yes stop_codon:yes gene_type:complete
MTHLGRFPVSVNSDGFELIGGRLLTRLGLLLECVEIIEVDGLSVEMLEVEARQIRKVHVHDPSFSGV